MQDAILNAVQPLFDAFQEKVIETVSDTVKQVWDKFVAGFNNRDANIVVIEFDTLDKGKLIEIAADNKVNGSTEVAAYKVSTDDDYIIYLAYTHNKELMDTSVNKYISIRTKSLARDVEKLFNNDQLILLK